MASGVRTRGRGSRAGGSCRSTAGAPSADRGVMAPQQLNPEFVAMPAADLIAHLIRSRRTADFADVALVFAERERRLADAEVLVRMGNDRMDMLRDEIVAREYSALKAEAQIRRAAETEMGLRAEIRALQLRVADAEARARHGSGISGLGLMQQAGRGRSREPVPRDFATAASDVATGEEAHGEEVDCEVLEDFHGASVMAGHKVPKEEAQGEDVVARRHGHSQGELPARATQKVQKQKGTSFYKNVLNALLKDNQELLKKEEERLSKEAAATASKLLYLRCWPNGLYMPSESAAMEEDSSDGPNDS